MFVRKIKRANGEVSIVLVEGYRLNGKVKQRTLAYLGTESELTKDDPDAVKKLIEKYKNEQAQKEAFVKLVLNLAERIPEENTVRNYGYFYLEKMYRELGLDRVCQAIQGNAEIEYSLDDCLRLMCFMRALCPGSKKTSLDHGQRYFTEDFDLKLEQVYKSLTVLAENKKQIVSAMHEALCRQYGRKTDILYYDVTNYFFEIDEPDDFRKKGCSKEYRPLPIVQMGLFIDQAGLPVDFYLYEGNKPDCTTLKPSFDEIKERYAASRVIITADKGLNSGANLGRILSEGNGYIVSQRIRGAKKSLVDQVLEDAGWMDFGGEGFRLKDFVRTIPVTFPDGTVHEHKQKVVCIWSRKYQCKEQHERDNLLERVAQLAANPNKFKQSCHSGMKKYVQEILVDRETGEVAQNISTVTSLDEDKIEADKALDGFYLIVTSETQLTASEVIEKYRGLWRIEQSFRVTKSDIRARPVFVRTKEHITAHFLTCFITLTMLRMLEIRLGRRHSCRRIIEALNSGIATELAKGIYSINKRDEILDELDRGYRQQFSCRYIKQEALQRYRQGIMSSVYTTS